MNSPQARFLGGAKASAPDPPDAVTVDSDLVVILAALLCALICVVGLAAVVRCAWLRRISRANISPAQAPANKGLKKSVLRSIPKLVFNGAGDGKLADCAICLSEFAAGDEVRVLPLCGHGFHVGCIDTWLGSHSSCPSCRRILVVARCRKCGEFPAPISSDADLEAGCKAREGDPHRFLP
ncbi:hypothetical protein Scep_000076 [Stephania cephalantha]|uniref:RING-type domain-containing protein n=1 Tax=Stephania cephalantha TaxID=152367 RepID=A0AAP0L6D8_9MAGN